MCESDHLQRTMIAGACFDAVRGEDGDQICLNKLKSITWLDRESQEEDTVMIDEYGPLIGFHSYLFASDYRISYRARAS